MYSHHKILKLCLKDIQQKVQRNFILDDETIIPNQKDIHHILKVAMEFIATGAMIMFE